MSRTGVVKSDRIAAGDRDEVSSIDDRLERWTRAAELASAALAPALEAVPGAAWVVDATCHVVQANAAARLKLDEAEGEVHAMLTEAVSGRAPADVRVSRFSAEGGGEGFVVVQRASGANPRAAAILAARVGLTPAQARVLEHVAKGSSNATIAARLGIAERTVEAHVTAILAKAQVSSRAALIAMLLG